MNALNVVGSAMLDERKINCLQALFYFLMEALFVLNIFLITR